MLISWSPCLTRNWLFNEHRMHVMRVCVDAIWFWMTLSLFWTFFMGNLISFSNFNESKNSSLYPDTLLLFTLLSKKYFLFLSCKRKLNINDTKKEERKKMEFATFVSDKYECRVQQYWLMNFFFVEYSRICIHLRFILSSSDETNFKILYKYADVIHSILVKKKVIFKPPRGIQ